MPISMSERELRSQQTFMSLMWALSRPGSSQPAPGCGLDAFVSVGETLLDLETSYYTPDPALSRRLAPTGARLLGPEQARYQLYPQLLDEDLERLRAAPLGSQLYPDESATLVLGGQLGAGARLRLSGPGVAGTLDLDVAGLPARLWALRAALARYPLGWDIVLICGPSLLGIPRTTHVEVL